MEHILLRGSRVMKREIKIVLVVSLVLVIAVPSILVWFSLTQRFIFSRSLHVTDFIQSEDAYTAHIVDSGREIAHIHFRIETPQPSSNRIPIEFSIAHDTDTELDALRLRFTTEASVTSLFLEASTYEWPALEFHREGIGILFSVNDLGWYGASTIRLDFILYPDSSSSALSLTIDFAMHYLGFMPLTTLQGYAVLNTQLPNVN